MNQQTAVCPKCGGEYNHPVQLEVNPYGPEGRERILVSSKQVKVERYHEPTVRGVIIRILFLCENGHIWENRVSFHKGQGFRFTKDRPTCKTTSLVMILIQKSKWGLIGDTDI
jgi:hypothetical protein